MKHISEIIQLEALVIRIVYVCCVDTNESPNHVCPRIIMDLDSWFNSDIRNRESIMH